MTEAQKKELKSVLDMLYEICMKHNVPIFILASINKKTHEAYRTVFGDITHIHSMFVETFLQDGTLKSTITSALLAAENLHEFIDE